MAQCEEQGFKEITPEQFALFLAKGEQMGLPGLAGKGPSGEASHSGVTIRWNYDAAGKTLHVQCTESPTLLPCTFINSRIKEAVASVLGGPAEQD